MGTFFHKKPKQWGSLGQMSKAVIDNCWEIYGIDPANIVVCAPCFEECREVCNLANLTEVFTSLGSGGTWKTGGFSSAAGAPGVLNGSTVGLTGFPFSLITIFSNEHSNTSFGVVSFADDGVGDHAIYLQSHSYYRALYIVRAGGGSFGAANYAAAYDLVADYAPRSLMGVSKATDNHKVYRNGILGATSTITTAFPSNMDTFSIGSAAYAPPSYLPGHFGLVVVFKNHALIPEQALMFDERPYGLLEPRLIQCFSFSSVHYDETLRSVTITSTVSVTDVQTYLAEECSVLVVSTISETDLQDYSDRLSLVVVLVTVNLSEFMGFDELSRFISITLDISDTDIQTYVDDLTIALNLSPTVTDVQTYVDTDLAISMILGISAFDSIPYNDTDLLISFTSAVSVTDNQGYSEILNIPFSMGVVKTDIQTYIDDMLILMGMSVKLSDTVYEQLFISMAMSLAAIDGYATASTRQAYELISREKSFELIGRNKTYYLTKE